MYTLFTICATIVECYLLFRITNSMLSFKFRSNYRFVPFLLYLMLSICRYIVIENMSDSFYFLAKTSSIFLIFMVIILFYTENLVAKLIWYSVNFFINMTTDIVALFLICLLLHQNTAYIMNNTTTYLYCTIISKFLNLLVIELIVRRQNNKIIVPKTFRCELILILVLDCLLILSSLLLTAKQKLLIHYSTSYITAILLTVLLISQITISLCYKLTNLANNEMEHRLRVQRYEMESKLNEDLSNVINNLRSLRHDMNNHIGIIKGLVETSEYTILKQYLNDINTELTDANNFVFVTDQALLILLNSKISKAQQKDIKMENNILVNQIKISDKDMCSLLGNVIDNAIEAAEKNNDNRFIRLEIQEKSNYCFILCENTFSEKPTIYNGKFITSKKDSANHGIGTETVRSIVKKYNGTIDYTINDLFSVSIILPYSNQSVY